MAESDQEKSEQPTARKKRKAREDGNVSQSPEVNNTLFFAVAILLFTLIGDFMLNHLKEYLQFTYVNLNYEINENSLINLTYIFVKNFAVILAPFIFPLLITAFISSYIQFGWLWSTKALEWKWENIVKWNFKEMFSSKALINLVKSLIKISVLLLISYLVMHKELQNIMNFVDMTVEQIFSGISRLAIKLILSVLYFYIFFAIGDFIIQKYQHLKKLKMTKQEVKDERKQMEGDPQVKNRIRNLMMQESRKRMMQEVPKADVVITNPTHIAVALKYSPAEDDAPIVLAKGKRLIAQKIKEIAKENDIPIVEDKPLARMLYKTSVIGYPIDISLYGAVAEILAQIYNLKGKKKKY